MSSPERHLLEKNLEFRVSGACGLVDLSRQSLDTDGCLLWVSGASDPVDLSWTVSAAVWLLAFELAAFKGAHCER